MLDCDCFEVVVLFFPIQSFLTDPARCMAAPGTGDNYLCASFYFDIQKAIQAASCI